MPVSSNSSDIRHNMRYVADRPSRRRTNQAAHLLSRNAQTYSINADYRDDILWHMAEMQDKTQCDPNNMSQQPDIEWYMRPQLLDFLVQAHASLGLSQQTLFLAVNIIDRYTSTRVVLREQYQLVGAVGLWIASKYTDKKEHIASLGDLRLLCAGAYSSEVFYGTEMVMLNTLNWTIGHPTYDLYVDINIDDLTTAHGYTYSDSDVRTLRCLSMYVCEVAMYQKALLSYKPATIATAAVALAHWIWSYNCQFQTAPYVCNGVAYHCNSPRGSGQVDSDTEVCLNLLSNYVQFPEETVEHKYSQPKFGRVYLLVEEFVCRPMAVSQPLDDDDDEYMGVSSPGSDMVIEAPSASVAAMWPAEALPVSPVSSTASHDSTLSQGMSRMAIQASSLVDMPPSPLSMVSTASSEGAAVHTYNGPCKRNPTQTPGLPMPSVSTPPDSGNY